MITENISIGGFIGAYSARYELPNIFFVDEDHINYSFFNIGALGNYHFVNNDQWNVYAGATLGYLSINLSNDLIEGAADIRSSGIAFGIQGGARYFFSDNFAANAQLGYGLAILSLGVTYKL
jgi:opacity protein-like surface antigen